MDLHKEIGQWLFAFRLIPGSSPALSPNAQLSDLVAVLRDGVVLCQLVHSLDPSSVDMTRVLVDTGSEGGRAVSDFLCRNNIFLFLHAIVANFNLVRCGTNKIKNKIYFALTESSKIKIKVAYLDYDASH